MSAKKRKVAYKSPNLPTSEFVGVSWDIIHRSWRGQIWDGGKKLCLGFFEDEVAAALAWDAYARTIVGGRARTTNFSMDGTRLRPGLAKSSKYRGVSWDKKNGAWKVQLRTSGSNPEQFRSACERCAALAWDRLAAANGITERNLEADATTCDRCVGADFDQFMGQPVEVFWDIADASDPNAETTGWYPAKVVRTRESAKWCMMPATLWGSKSMNGLCQTKACFGCRRR
jgi:hypothetical protein